MVKLTLEEAIAHAKEVAEKNYRGVDFESIDSIDDDIKTNCIKCAEEHMQLVKWLEELKSYKGLEEHGLLVRLPCKVGDTVYVPTRNFISELRITMASINSRGKLYFSWVLDDDRGIYPNLDGFSGYELGKTVFLTREEAVKKLEEMNNNGQKKQKILFSGITIQS